MIILSLSGGMDSATLLGHLDQEGWSDIHACSFYYGSKHNIYENHSAEKLAKYYSIPLFYIDISNIMSLFKSNLLLTGESIPEGHYQSEQMRQTVVPSRNLIFSSIMAGIAESMGASAIALGVHSGDHYIYPDCRFEFIQSLDKTIHLSTDGKVKVIAPFINLFKEDILTVGYNLDKPVPYHLTRTCYKAQFLSCGKCGSCVERLEAFHKIGKEDPIQYE